MIAPNEIFTTAIKAIRTNRTRSILTTLGIIIGVAAVIAALAVGEGTNKVIDEQISSFGSNFIMVFPDRGGNSSNKDRIAFLTLSDAQAIEREVSGIEAISPVVDLSANLIYKNSNWSSDVSGVGSSHINVTDFKISSGRNITETDIKQSAKVAVLGSTVVEKLFYTGFNPIGEVIRIDKVPFKVVGVLESKGISSMGLDQDDFVLVPLTAAQKRLVRFSTPGRINYIYVKAVSMDALNYVQHETELVLREKHRIKRGEDDDFAVRNVTQMLEARRQANQTLTFLLYTIALISLLVGGIGIMNIMFVSVTERTKEIGIRLAIGATQNDIKVQFLVESSVLSMFGGAIGILLGFALGYVLATFVGVIPIFSLSSLLISFFFSAAVGIGFGYYPASMASSMNPIDALKYE